MNDLDQHLTERTVQEDEIDAIRADLKIRRDALGMTNQTIADKAGLSVATVNNCFGSRTKTPTAYTLGRICMVLEVSMDRAFGIADTSTDLGYISHRLKLLQEDYAELGIRAEAQRKECARQKEVAEKVKKAVWALGGALAAAMVCLVLSLFA